MISTKILERYKDYPVFTRKDLDIFLSKENRLVVNKLIEHLVKTKKIFRLSKGVYTLHNEQAVIGFLYRPFYYGLQHALTLRNIWGQTTNPIIVTAKTPRTGRRSILNQAVIVRKINKKYFFGYDLLKQEDFNVPVSDLEKTLIDFVVFRIKLDDETMRELVGKIDTKKLNDYLKVYPKRIKKKIENKLVQFK